MAKIVVGIRIRPALMERLRNAIWHIGKGLTLSSVIEEALLKIIEDMETRHNRGKPFRRAVASWPNRRSPTDDCQLKRAAISAGPSHQRASSHGTVDSR
jgi:hypothetical protein